MWVIVSAEMTDMRCFVLWVTACLENVRGWMATDKEGFLFLCVKSYFSLSYGFIIFSLHCILLV